MKTKLIFLIASFIFCTFFLTPSVYAFSIKSLFGGGDKGISRDVFPQDITSMVEGAYDQPKPVKLDEVTSARGEGVVGGYTANYSGEGYWVYTGAWQMKSGDEASRKAAGWLDERKKIFEDPENKKKLDAFKIEWGNVFHWKVAGYETTATTWGVYTNWKCDVFLSCTPIINATMFAAVDNYFIFVEVKSIYYYPSVKLEQQAKDHINQAQGLFEFFVKQVKTGSSAADTSKTEAPKEKTQVGLSESVFPLELIGLPRQTVYKMTSDDLSDYWGKLYEVTDAYLVTYYTPPEDSSAFHVFVQAFALKDEKRTSEYLTELSALTKKDMEEKSSDKCEAIRDDLVAGHPAKYFSCTSSGDPKDYDHKLDIFVAARNYLVWVKLVRDSSGFELQQAEEGAWDVLEKLGVARPRAKTSKINLIDNVVSALKNIGKRGQKEEVREQKSIALLTPEEKLEFKGKQTECGDKSCDTWGGEDCKVCPLDCLAPNSCCAPDQSYMYPKDYNSKIYKLYKSGSGSIPEGMMSVKTGTLESDLFNSWFNPFICHNGQGVQASCLTASDCPKGVCKNNACEETVTTGGKFKEVVSEEVRDEIIYDQTVYAKEFVDTYVKLKNNAIYHEKGPGFEAQFFVFGDSENNEFVEVVKGKTLDARLEIQSLSQYDITVFPRIFYTKGLKGEENTELTDEVEELKYTLSTGSSGVVSSYFGSWKAVPLSGNHIQLPPGGKVIVYSKVSPKQKGMIYAKAKILYSSELKEVSKNAKLIWVNKTPEEFEQKKQVTELRRKVYVSEPDCIFWSLLCM